MVRLANRRRTSVAKKRSKSNSGKRASAQPRFDHLRLQETLGFLLSDATRTMTQTFLGADRRPRGRHGHLSVSAHPLGGGWIDAKSVGGAHAHARAVCSRRFIRPGAARPCSPPRRPQRSTKVCVLLTAEGRKLYDLVMPDIAATNGIMLAGFSAAEQELLKSMLRRIRENLAAAETAPPARKVSRRAASAHAPIRDGRLAAGLLVSAEAGPVLALQEVADSLAVVFFRCSHQPAGLPTFSGGSRCNRSASHSLAMILRPLTPFERDDMSQTIGAIMTSG